jgi:hypothetical protein
MLNLFNNKAMVIISPSMRAMIYVSVIRALCSSRRSKNFSNLQAEVIFYDTPKCIPSSVELSAFVSSVRVVSGAS